IMGTLIRPCRRPARRRRIAVVDGLGNPVTPANNPNYRVLTGITNIQGTVQIMDKDTSTIMVRVNANVTRQIVYGPTTKFLYGHSDNNKPGAVAQVKENDYISCAGPVNSRTPIRVTASWISVVPRQTALFNCHCDVMEGFEGAIAGNRAHHVDS